MAQRFRGQTLGTGFVGGGQTRERADPLGQLGQLQLAVDF